MKYKNGAIVQQLTFPTNYLNLDEKRYLGINAFYDDPLMSLTDDVSQKLSDEISFRKTDENLYQQTFFISNQDLLRRYTAACKEKNIPIRVLFVESDYEHERWSGELPKMMFIGYEYCEIPFDNQIITDFDWYEPLSRFKKMLNRYGLFDTLQGVMDYKGKYDREFDAGNVGDGEFIAFICKIYEVDIDNL